MRKNKSKKKKRSKKRERNRQQSIGGGSGGASEIEIFKRQKHPEIVHSERREPSDFI